jgi:hypothetical protein
MTERQKFDLVTRYEKFEIRAYHACVIAQIEMSTDYSAATSGAFRYLFNYISRGNQTSTPIAMTAPVIASTEGSLDSHHWRISFVMPAGSSIKDLPAPKDSTVVLVEKPTENCAVLSFRGRATIELSRKKERELRLFAHDQNYALSEEVRICRFDPPFKPGLIHYNEIVIPVLENVAPSSPDLVGR